MNLEKIITKMKEIMAEKLEVMIELTKMKIFI